MAELRTSRLLLRPWRDADLPAYAAMNVDPKVRRWFPSTLTREQSDAQASRLQGHIAAHGFGSWAVKAPGVAPFIGFVGLEHVDVAAPFTSAVQAGWRPSREHWGRGYATEAARTALAHGLGPLRLAEIVVFTVPGNAASQEVMRRIGMPQDPKDDFDDPDLPDGSPFRRNVLYRAKLADPVSHMAA